MKELAPLTLQQDRFAREFVVDFNATKALARAGMAGGDPAKLLRNPVVTSRIAQLAAKMFEEAGLRAIDVLLELKNIAFLDPLDIFDANGQVKKMRDIPERARRCISAFEIDERTSREDGAYKVTKVRLAAKEKALELLGRYFALFKDTLALEGGRRPIQFESEMITEIEARITILRGRLTPPEPDKGPKPTVIREPPELEPPEDALIVQPKPMPPGGWSVFD